MKKMKKMIAVLLAAVMILGMNLNVFATGGSEPTTQSTTGSIAIVNPLEGQTYDIYLMFELVSYSGDAYLYKILDEWVDFVKNDTVAKEFFEIYDETELYVRSKENKSNYTNADLAKAAVAYATRENSGINVVESLPNTENGVKSYSVNNLEKLGYYVVDSSAGALCSLTTTDPIAQVREKNSAPTAEKYVLEDANRNGKEDEGETWGEANDAEIGDTVFFKTKITAMPGAHNYILHDRMGDGLTLNPASIKVVVGNSSSELKGYLVDANTHPGFETDEGYHNEGYNYYVLYNVESQAVHSEVCDFEVHFTEQFLATITTETPIYVTYSAKLNEAAKLHSERNVNATQLEYGENNFTTLDSTYTHTYMFDLIKTDANKTVLSGAEFNLYRETSVDTVDKVTKKDKDGSDVYLEKDPMSLLSLGNGNYLVVEKGRQYESSVITAGNVRIKGLDKGTYYLVETKAPAGYNKVDYAIEVDFKEDASTGLSGNIIGQVTSGKYVENSGGIQVINQTGTLLPETGGTGRTILYAAGSIFTVAAIVVIVTKKRMKHEE